MDRKASIKSITADTVTIAGYGVVFGGSDLDGETFTKDTDYMLDLVPNKLTPLLPSPQPLPRLTSSGYGLRRS